MTPSPTVAVRGRSRSLRELVGDCLRQSSQLLGKVRIAIEVEMPPIALESPVTHIDDPPLGSRLQVEDQIDAPAIIAVPFTTTEDDLTAITRSADLSSRETERHQNRVQDLGDDREVPFNRVRW